MFLGRPFRRREKQAKEELTAATVQDDEGGPASEELQPKEEGTGSADLEKVYRRLAAAIQQREPLRAIQEIVGDNPRVLQKKDSCGWLPLHRAAQFGSVEVVSYLADRCPDAMLVKDSYGSLPLHRAARHASLEVVRCLVDKCPNTLLQKTNDRSLPVDVARKHNRKHPDVFMWLEAPKLLAKQEPTIVDVEGLHEWLIAAIRQQKPLHVIQALVGFNPLVLQKKDSNNWLAMHIAARYSASLEVVQFLADKRPETMLVMADDGWLPLHFAVVFASVEVAQCLATKCPDALLVKQKGGWLPLHLAARHASLELVRCLVDNCPKALMEKTDDGSLPVDVARKHNKKHPGVVIWLEAAMRKRQDDGRVPNGRSPHSTPAPASAPDPHAQDRGRKATEHPFNKPKTAAQGPYPHTQDRDRIRKAIEDPSHEPARVSVAYVDSIRTEAFLGDGFFGTVFKGSDAVLAQEFAIKSINSEILRGGTRQELESAKKTFKTEQEALSRFRHPNIASLFAYTDPLVEGNAAGYHLVYELAEKGSLDRYLKDDLGRSRLGSFRRRVQVAIDVMTALQFLHKGNDQIKACFHRDVKSANIVLKRDFTAQLIDCGLAQFVNDDMKTTGIKGAKGYICPQYVRTGKYLPACDIYSFGVVMLELWTGRIQNWKGELYGTEFNFAEEYIYEGRDVHGDADPAMDLGSPLPESSARFAELALQCISERSKRRPSGDEVLKTLKAILDECTPSSAPIQGVGTLGGDASRGGDVCSTCRTFNSIPLHSICALCFLREEVRRAFAEMVSMNQSSGDALSKQIEDLGNRFDPKLNNLCQQVGGVITRLDAALPILAHLDRRLNNQVPRTFVLLPGDIKSGWKHPCSWLRSAVQKQHYLFFVCPVSQKAVSPPIKLMVAKDWFRKAAPVLATGLFLLQVGLKAGLNVSLALDGAAADLFHVSAVHVAEMLHELAGILDETKNRGLLDRLRSCGGNKGSSPGLSDQDVRELSGDAYELVIEKACEQDGWRSQMEPVRLPPSPKVFWVSKSVAQDPTYKYEIVKA